MLVLEVADLARKGNNLHNGWETPMNAWDHVEFVIPYQHQGSMKDASGSIIRKKVLYCIQLGGQPGYTGLSVLKHIYRKKDPLRPPRVRAL